MGCGDDLLADTDGRDDDKDPAFNEDGCQRLLVAHILGAIISHHVVGEVRVQAHACHMKPLSISFASPVLSEHNRQSCTANIWHIPSELQVCNAMVANACV